MTDVDLAQLKNRALGIRFRAEQALSSFEALSRQANPIRDGFNDTLTAELAGLAAGKLFGQRRTGRKLGRMYSVQNRRAQKQSLLDQHRIGALNLLGELSMLAQKENGGIPPRTAASLRATVVSARSLKGPAPILRKVIQAASRIETIEPPGPKALPAGPGVDYARLKSLEQALRDLIQGRLRKLTAQWWETRVPQGVRMNAEKRLQARDRKWPWHNDGSTSPIDFLDFSDYAKIITDPPNWNDAFREVFGEAKVIEVKLLELEPIRNAIAHSRDISQQHREKLRLYSGELLTLMGK